MCEIIRNSAISSKIHFAAQLHCHCIVIYLGSCVYGSWNASLIVFVVLVIFLGARLVLFVIVIVIVFLVTVQLQPVVVLKFLQSLDGWGEAECLEALLDGL